MSADKNTLTNERGVDPQSNVDVILACLNATAEEHRFEQETEWLEICGYPERVAWRWAAQQVVPAWFTSLLDSLRLPASHRRKAGLSARRWRSFERVAEPDSAEDAYLLGSVQHVLRQGLM